MTATLSLTPELSLATDAEVLVLLAEDLEAGLRLILDQLVPRVRGALRRQFGQQLAEEVDDGLNWAMHQVARRHGAFDADRGGTLRAWIFRIARNRVIDQLEARERGWLSLGEELLAQLTVPAPDEPDGAADVAEGGAEPDARIAALHACIAALPTMQRCIALADLRAGGAADAAALAAELGTTTNSIYVSRNKARKSLRRRLSEEGHAP